MVKKTVATTLASPESEEAPRPKIDPNRLRRKKPEQDDDTPHEEPKSVSAGAVEKALDLAFNPSREKLPEVTIIDRTQGRLFPVIEIINHLWSDVLEVAYYRQNKDEYQRVFKKKRPVSLNLLAELLFHTAQWQKSVAGTNLTKITDIALAETETRAGDEGEGYGNTDAWGKE